MFKTFITTYLQKDEIFLAKNRNKFPQLFQLTLQEITIVNIN